MRRFVRFASPVLSAAVCAVGALAAAGAASESVSARIAFNSSVRSVRKAAAPSFNSRCRSSLVSARLARFSSERTGFVLVIR